MTIFKPRCPALHPERAHGRCGREEGHGLNHRTFTGTEWNTMTRHSIDPEDTDGGVTAAAIEKDVDGYTAEDFARAEFARHPRSGRIAARLRSERMYAWTAGRDEERLRDDQMHGWVPVRECPDPDAHWRIVEAFERAEKAEEERNDARHEVLALRDDLARAEAINNDVTDAMIQRAWQVNSDLLPSTIGRMLAAALAEPTRPHGAEELDGPVRTTLVGHGQAPDYETVKSIADALAERGVRLTEEES